MRARLLVPAMLTVIVVSGGFAIAGARATPKGRASNCTAAEKAQRQAALIAYRKRMANQRRTYFASHKSVTLRRAFVHRQQLLLKKLETAAACTVLGTSHTARLAQLRAYASELKAVTSLLDPAVTAPAEDALATITNDEENCATDPESYDCPVPASEYQATAKSLRDATGQFKKLATKLAAIVAPTMSVADYNDAAVAAAADCGVDLTTIATAHKRLLNTTNKWESTLGRWADTYAAGKSVDWDTEDYLPGAGSFGDDSRAALALWAVMVNAYWSSLAESRDVTSAPPVPEWIGSLNDAECPPPG